MTFNLVPQPRRIRIQDGLVEGLTDVAIIVPPESYSPLRLTISAFRQILDATGNTKSALYSTSCVGDAYPIVLSFDKSIRHTQGYQLVIGQNSIRLTAATNTGLNYAVLTLSQIIEQSQGVPPPLHITDEPAIPERGVMLDISRCKVPTLDTLKTLIGQLSALKINQLQLYTEHTFAFSNHHEVWKNASPITAEDVLELDHFCRERFIELVPNFNSFGHWERWLKHPAYAKYANSPTGYTNPWGTEFPHGSLLKPNRETQKLLDQLYVELLPNFTSERFNVGCDETFELGTEWSAGICKRKGTERVYLDFLKAINRLCKKHGKVMMFWGDIIMKHPGLIPELPEEAIALEWGYEANHPFAKDCKAFAASGIPFYVCPGTSSWNSLTGRTGNAFANLSSAARNGVRQNARGYLITDWGDNGHHQYLPISYLPFTAGAALSWNARKQPDIERAAGRIFFGDSKSAPLFAELGRTHEHFTTPFFNSTVFHHLLFHGKVPHEKLVGLNRKELTDAREKLRNLRERNHEIKDRLIRREFRNAVDMALFALHRGLLIQGQHERAPSLANIKKQHRALWLSRNRPGGLRESLSRLPRH